jgi:hypothetical protein
MLLGFIKTSYKFPSVYGGHIIKHKISSATQMGMG